MFEETSLGDTTVYKTTCCSFMVKPLENNKFGLRCTSKQQPNSRNFLNKDLKTFCVNNTEIVENLSEVIFDNCDLGNISLFHLLKNKSFIINITFLHCHFNNISLSKDVKVNLFIYGYCPNIVVKYFKAFSKARIFGTRIVCQKINAHNISEIESILEKNCFDLSNLSFLATTLFVAEYSCDFREDKVILIKQCEDEILEKFKPKYFKAFFNSQKFVPEVVIKEDSCYHDGRLVNFGKKFYE